MDKNIEFVVTITAHDGTIYRGIQKAWYGNPAIDFFAKKLGLTSYKSGWAEKKHHFDHFLAQGLRTPLPISLP